MRVLPLVIALVAVAIPLHAIAKPRPKIAIAPLEGDTGNKVGQAVVGALAGKDFAVIGPKDTRRELAKLGAPDELGAKDVKKLLTRLGAIAIVDGKVGKAGKKRSLHLEIHRRGKPDAGFTLEFKTAGSEGFRRGVHQEIVKKLDGATEDTDDDDERAVAARPADDDAPRRKLTDDDAPRRKLTDDDGDARRGRKPAADDDAAPRRKPAADDDATARRGKPRDDDAPARRPAARDDDEHRPRVAADDDDLAVTKRRSRKRGDAAASSRPLARVDAGASVAQRRLSFATRAGFTQLPPRVVTTAAGGRVDGEVYPFALASSSSSVANLGFAAAYDKTFGLAIKVPNQAVSAPINQAHYALGARYRIALGAASSLALGLDYAGRSYVANRAPLMTAVLDTPDFRYTAVVPGVSARTPLTETISLFGGVDGMVILDAGAVTKNANYGKATVYGLEAAGGLDVALTRQINLRVALEYSQMSFSFGTTGTMATGRDNDPATQDVLGATDRYIGGVATLGLVY